MESLSNGTKERTEVTGTQSEQGIWAAHVMKNWAGHKTAWRPVTSLGLNCLKREKTGLNQMSSLGDVCLGILGTDNARMSLLPKTKVFKIHLGRLNL